MRERRGTGRMGNRGASYWEDEMISLCGGTCCSLTLPVPRPPDQEALGVRVGWRIFTIFQVINRPTVKLGKWSLGGLESPPFLRMLYSGRALSKVRWRGPVALKFDVMYVILKNVTLSTAPVYTSNQIASPCGDYIFAKSSLPEWGAS